jgi:hypothetical protein
MRFKKLRLLGLLFMTPLTVLASGQFMLPALFVDLLLLGLVTVLIFGLKIKWTGKLILLAIYLTALFLTMYLFDVSDYLENEKIVLVTSAVLPPTILYLSYQLIKDKFKKIDV